MGMATGEHSMSGSGWARPQLRQTYFSAMALALHKCHGDSSAAPQYLQNVTPATDLGAQR